MAIGETVRAAWSGGGRKWLLIGAVGGGAYLWYTRARASSSGAAGATIDPATGSATTPGAVPDTTDPATSDGPTRPQSNTEWLDRAVETLIAPPYNRPVAATWNALNKALEGEPLSSSEGAIVELAIQIGGTPPEGMPPLNISAPTPVTKPSITPATKPAAVKPTVTVPKPAEPKPRPVTRPVVKPKPKPKPKTRPRTHHPRIGPAPSGFTPPPPPPPPPFHQQW